MKNDDRQWRHNLWKSNRQSDSSGTSLKQPQESNGGLGDRLDQSDREESWLIWFKLSDTYHGLIDNFRPPPASDFPPEIIKIGQ